MILRDNLIPSYIARKCLLVVTLVSIYFVARSIAVTQFGIVTPLTSVNCSSYCHCQLQAIQNEIQNRYQKHNSISGSKYGEDFKTSSQYSDFLGLFSIVVGNMVAISCHVNDGRSHYISSLLNGIEYLKYAALSVTCMSGEELVWDVPSWQVSFNIFESNKCKIVSESTSLVIPMNMWIFEVDNVGHDLINTIDLRYATNTLSLSIEGTDTFNIPDKWHGDALISLDRFSLESNGLKRFDCKIQFTKHLDTIDLNNNELSKFPECLLRENSVNIRFLSLSNNDISDISSLFSQVPFESTVECVDLSFNSIQKIGTIMKMKKLTILDLSNNQILQINDDAFNQLYDLKQLHLQNNRIHYIGPVAFRENIKLRLLKLSGNSLKYVSGDQFPTIEPLVLDVRKNRLRTPPFISEIRRKEFPQNLNIFGSNNPFHCDCALIAFEEFLETSGQGLQNFSKGKDYFIDLNLFKCASPRKNKGKLTNRLSFIEACPVLDNCPPTCECTLKNKTDFVVNCTGRRLLEMPESIPMYPKAKEILDLSHNPLQLLGHRSYLANLSELYMDNCLMTSISPLAISALHNIKVLTLHNNLLQKLPSNSKNITLKRASNVTLHNNRWSCSCDSLWLPKWISSHHAVIWKTEDILCSYLKKPVEDFKAEDVNCESFSHKDVILALTMVVSSLLSTFLLFYFYTKELKLFLYSKLGIRLCADFSYGDLFSPYDAFVSYGQDNYKWVVDTLVPTLEEGPKKYKLCLHFRDFPTNEPNIDNIPWAIRLSRCSILILSNDFLKKEWCILELRAIFQRMLMAANKLIVIVTEDVNPEDLPIELRNYLNTHDYLKTGETRFWEKLEMFLPPKEAYCVKSNESQILTTEENERELDEESVDCNGGNGGEGDVDAEVSFNSTRNQNYESGDYAEDRGTFS